MNKNLITIFLFIVILIGVQVAFADPLPIVPPREVTSGAIYNQQMHTDSKTPNISADNVVIEKESYAKPMQEDNGIKILVKDFKLSGDQILPDTTFIMLLEEYKGKELTLQDLNIAVEKITQYLRNNDYAVATAYLPEQDIQDGIVEITIMGGKYGELNIENKSKLKPAIIALNTMQIKTGAYIKLSEIEKVALLLNDIPGVNAKVNLSAGKEQGSSNVNISLVDAEKLINYSFMADNYGGYYTTPEQAGFNIVWSNLGGFGERINFQAKSSGSGLWLGAVSYNRPVGKMGATMGVSYSTVNYTLGKGYASLGATGIADVASLNYNLPLKRTRTHNLYFTANFDNAILKDDNNLGNQNQAKKVNRLILGLNGDALDNWCGGGMMTYNLKWTNGQASMDSDYSKTLDQALGTSGRYSKVALVLNRNQKLQDRLSLWLNVNGQWTDRNLVSFEDISLGGPYGVRAYPVGEATGDIGWIGNAEVRWLMPMPKTFPGTLQLAAFYDYGWVTVNSNPTVNGYTQPGPNTISLAGYGLGLTWSKPDFGFVTLSYAWKDKKYVNTAAPDKAGQLWVSMNLVL